MQRLLIYGLASHLLLWVEFVYAAVKGKLPPSRQHLQIHQPLHHRHLPHPLRHPAINGGGHSQTPSDSPESHTTLLNISARQISSLYESSQIREKTPQLLLVHGQLGRPESHQQLFLVSGGFKRCPETQEASNDRTFRKDKFPTLWIISRWGRYYCKLYKRVHS